LTGTALVIGAYGTSSGSFIDSSCLSLHQEAARGAITDAGLEPSDIDGVICAYSLTEPHLMLASWFCEYSGLKPHLCFSIQAGGATAAIMVMQAAMIVKGGSCRNILVVTGDNRLSGLSRDGTVAALAQVGHPEFERPYGMSIPAAYALVANRYMHEYNVTSRHLDGVSVAMRKHAHMTPGAHKRDLITLKDVAESAMISSPLRLLHCSLISDSAAAMVISSKSSGLCSENAPVAIIGSGQGHTHQHIISAPSLTKFGCHQSARAAFAEARIKPNNIDFVEIYDSFSITLLIELESMGFFAPGEAGSAILEGALDITGFLPCNTHGGLLSHGHSGAAGGMFHFVEAVNQLRGDRTPHQVKDPHMALVHGDGGILSSHCSIILSRV
jgi:acetyl-CoA acetyltransferase